MELDVAAEGSMDVANGRLNGVRRIVLTGFMGAGKSTVGRMLAGQLGWEFLDLDEGIERRAGNTVASIFAEHGETHFRRLESITLASSLGRSRLVLALGGGTPEVLTNRLLLEQSPGTSTVFLSAPFPVLFDRCMLQALKTADENGRPDRPLRPLLSHPDTAEARFRARLPIYRRLAHLTLETERLTAEETVELTLERLTAAAVA